MGSEGWRTNDGDGRAAEEGATYSGGVPIFSGASRGAVLALECPHCGVLQARAREKEGTTYRCRDCKREFTREEGLAKAAASDAARKGSSRRS